MINIGTSALYHTMRVHAWDASFIVIVAAIAGIFPDAISHGIILSGRDGHFELAIIGVFLIACWGYWYGLCWALVRRYGTTGYKSMEMVDNG
jgi:hypothetical protein